MKNASSLATPEKILEHLYVCYQEEGLHEAEKQLTDMLVSNLLPDTSESPGASYAQSQQLLALVYNLRWVLASTRHYYGHPPK